MSGEAEILHEIVDRLPYGGGEGLARAHLHAKIAAAAGEDLDEEWAETHGVTAEQLAELQEVESRPDAEPDAEPEPAKSAAAKKAAPGSK